jgi:hypothetical protein
MATDTPLNSSFVYIAEDSEVKEFVLVPGVPQDESWAQLDLPDFDAPSLIIPCRLLYCFD